MNNHPQNSDARIDQILHALRDTESPTGLEARITARIANAAEVRPIIPSYFAVILNAVKAPRILFAESKFYTFAATTLALLLALSLFTLHLHHKPHTIAQSNPLPLATTPQTPPRQITLVQARPTAQAAPNGHHQSASSLPSSPTTLTDPDAIALAETLAPSHPVPPMPLTPQERLLFSATRQGEPIEIAELELARGPILRAAAKAHEKAGLQQFARNLVSQLVTSESLDPTPHSDVHDSPQTTPASNAPSSSPNQ
jgi:hypothetical protein